MHKFLRTHEEYKDILLLEGLPVRTTLFLCGMVGKFYVFLTEFTKHMAYAVTLRKMELACI